MKKTLLLGLILICFLAGNALADGVGASGRDVNWQVLNTPGVHGIAFTGIVQEITVVTWDTHPSYCHWTSSLTVSTSCFPVAAVLTSSQTVPMYWTEKIQSNNFSIRFDSGTANRLIQWKMW